MLLLRPSLLLVACLAGLCHAHQLSPFFECKKKAMNAFDFTSEDHLIRRESVYAVHTFNDNELKFSMEDGYVGCSFDDPEKAVQNIFSDEETYPSTAREDSHDGLFFLEVETNDKPVAIPWHFIENVAYRFSCLTWFVPKPVLQAKVAGRAEPVVILRQPLEMCRSNLKRMQDQMVAKRFYAPGAPGYDQAKKHYETIGDFSSQ